MLLGVIWRSAPSCLAVQGALDIECSFILAERTAHPLLPMNVSTFDRLIVCLHIRVGSRPFDVLTCKDKGLGSQPFFAHGHLMLLHEQQCQDRRLKGTLPSSLPRGGFIRKESISFYNTCKLNGYNCGAFYSILLLSSCKKQTHKNIHVAQ